MLYKCQSGEAIQVGDRVLVHDEPGYIELICDPDQDPEDWYVKEFGGGVMVVEPKVFGRIFFERPELADSHLEFVSRTD